MTSSDAQRGFTYVAALIAVFLVGASLVAFSETWSRGRQREKEAELLWIGNQFRQAIGLYYQRSPGAVKRYPERLEDLLEDRRFLTKQRYLRTIYVDPMTGRTKWGLVEAPGGGISGVYTLAEGKPVRTSAFPEASAYRDWIFVYLPPEARP